ncbi:exosortase/archaeosortase [Pseudomonas fluvialis]|uniref:Exosortase/archaeosortase n=1 Tax=Pseudomonas fluvialis TaxID=1793966 RepID=A0A7X0EW31_9PSED|nr:DUF2523 domain-containing protein [Pseudomonas fluvialis]MBB6342051.1 exosortase/archaeosortase [Pseudomonas fluvialis]MBB6343206.1 exosortase/archaeosortase [Pseudomonas fluvialis]
MQYLYIAQLVFMIIGPLIRLVFRVIGLGFVTYFGFNALITVAQDYMISNMGQAGTAIQQILGLAKIDIAINIMLAAVTTRFIIAGINKATDKKRSQVWNPPGRDYIDA